MLSRAPSEQTLSQTDIKSTSTLSNDMNKRITKHHHETPPSNITAKRIIERTAEHYQRTPLTKRTIQGNGLTHHLRTNVPPNGIIRRIKHQYQTPPHTNTIASAYTTNRVKSHTIYSYTNEVRLFILRCIFFIQYYSAFLFRAQPGPLYSAFTGVHGTYLSHFSSTKKTKHTHIPSLTRS